MCHLRFLASFQTAASEFATDAVISGSMKDTVDHVVTEYGVDALRGASPNERARRLIAIAHPAHRDELQFNARKTGLLH